MENNFLPLSGEVPCYPFEQLSEIARSARYHLTKKNRTESQIITVQKLIFELIDFYFEDKKDEEINDLEREMYEARGSYDEYGYEDLYPFSEESNNDGVYWVFIGNDSDLGDIPTRENTDDIDALYDILEWLPDNESEDGFTDASPDEYFAVLTLSLISDVIISIEEFNKKAKDKSMSFYYMGNLLLQVGKSSSFMNEAYLEKKYEDKLSEALSENLALKNKLDALIGNSKKAEIQQKKNIDKAVNSRHKKNREAKNMVCEDWKLNKNNFKSAMKAAEHYAIWLEGKSYFFETITIRNWLYLYAKENNIKLS